VLQWDTRQCRREFFEKVNLMDTKAQATHFFVIGNMAYGRSTELDEALRNWVQHARPRTDTKVAVRFVDENAEMDGMGCLTYAVKHDLPDIVVPRKLIDKIDEVQELINELCEAAEDARYDIAS
jgi:hypothetical protein